MQTVKSKSFNLIYYIVITMLFGITTLLFFDQVSQLVDHFIYVTNDGFHQIASEPIRPYGY